MHKDFDVFLCHNSEDKPAVRELADKLQKNGVVVWLDEDDLPVGQPWQEHLERVIETTQAAAVLIGKSGFGDWQKQEMRALISQFRDRGLSVIPVLLPGFNKPDELPIFLKGFGCVDMRWGFREEDVRKLVLGIRAGTRQDEKAGDREEPGGVITEDQRGNVLCLDERREYLSVGVDIGTTKMAAALIRISKTGAIEIDTPIRREYGVGQRITTKEECRARLRDLVESALESSSIRWVDLSGIGVGFPGAINIDTGYLPNAPGLKLNKIETKRWLKEGFKLFKRDIFVDNDVNCSALAELVYGSGRTYNDFVCVNIGTGIGAGIVIDGRMYRGHSFSAGEIGHMQIDFTGNPRKCKCGQYGCFEEYASARAIIRMAWQKICDARENQEKSELLQLNPTDIAPQHIAQLVGKDWMANDLATDIAANIAVGLVNVANLINPQAIILGGGITEGFWVERFNMPGGDFPKLVRDRFEKKKHEACRTMIEISSLTYKDNNPAPIIGAALLPFEDKRLRRTY